MKSKLKSSLTAKVHPLIAAYADLLQVTPDRLLKILRRKVKNAALMGRFQAIRRLEKQPVPLKELLAP